MASPEEIRRLLDQLDRAYRRLGETNPFSRQETDVRKLEDALRGVENRLDAINDDFGDISASITATLGEIKQTNESLNSTTKAFRGISDIVNKVKYDQQGINTLSLKELDTLEQKLKQKVSDLRVAGSSLKVKLQELEAEKRALDLKKTDLETRKNNNRLSEAQRRQARKDLNNIEKDLYKNQVAIEKTNAAHDETIGFLSEENSLQETISNRIKFRQRQEEDINELLGLSGATLDGVNQTLNKMGMGKLSSILGIQDAQKDMSDLARAVVENKENVEKEAKLTEKINNLNRGGLSDRQIKAGFGGSELKNLLEQRDTLKEHNLQYAGLDNKTAILKKGISSMGASLAKNLKDPLVIVSFLLKQSFEAFKRIDTRSADLRKNLGLSGVESVNLNDQFAATALTSEYLGVTTDALVKSINDLNSSLGDTAIIFDQDLLETATVLRERFNMSEEALAGMTKESLSTGKSLESIKDEQLESLVAAEEMYQVNLNTNKTLDKANKITGALRLNLEKAPGGLVKAVALATKLGLEIEQTAKMAGKLLEFESSIEAELEAELLTGKQLNLEQARYFALQGKTAEAAAEIAKQVGSSAEFASMNVIQQQALASAAGLTTDELANALRTQESIGSEAEKFRDRTAEQAEEAATSLSIQDKLSKIMDKVAGIMEFSAIAAAALATALSLAFLPGIGGVAAATYGLIAGATMFAGLQLFKGDDILSPPPGGNGYGKRTLFGPEGSIALNDNDTIIAGTNLGGGKTETAPAASPSINIAPLVEQMNRMNATLQAILAKEGTVELDGTKVGTALTVGSYKLQ